MQTSNGPPTCICTLASGTVKPVGQNQRFMWSAELQALKTVSRGAAKVRETRTGAGSAARLVSLLCATFVSFVREGLEILAEPVEPLLPLRPPLVEPPLRLAQRRRNDVAGTHPPKRLPAHPAGSLPHGPRLH